MGHGHDCHDDRGRGGGVRVRGRRSLCDRVCLHAAARGNRFEALEPIRQGVRERFGDIGDGIARGLRLRHDHGSNYLADDFQQEVAFFGIESSPSFVREPEGNGVAERFIRTLKENLLWVRSFDTIEALRLALLEFKRTYNEQWMLEKYHYRSPAQVRRDLVGLAKAAWMRIPSNYCPRTLGRYKPGKCVQAVGLFIFVLSEAKKAADSTLK